MMVSDIDDAEMERYTLTRKLGKRPAACRLHILLHTSFVLCVQSAMVKRLELTDFFAKLQAR